jgi:hypothetical protein
MDPPRMYPFDATSIVGTGPNKIPDRITANDVAELFIKGTKDIFQGGDVGKGSKGSKNVPGRSIFPAMRARKSVMDDATIRAMRETPYRVMFLSGMFQHYRKFPRVSEGNNSSGIPSSAKAGITPLARRYRHPPPGCSRQGGEGGEEHTEISVDIDLI